MIAHPPALGGGGERPFSAGALRRGAVRGCATASPHNGGPPARRSWRRREVSGSAAAAAPAAAVPQTPKPPPRRAAPPRRVLGAARLARCSSSGRPPGAPSPAQPCAPARGTVRGCSRRRRPRRGTGGEGEPASPAQGPRAALRAGRLRGGAGGSAQTPREFPARFGNAGG